MAGPSSPRTRYRVETVGPDTPTTRLNGVCAVIVTYRPHREQLQAALTMAAAEADTVVIVDNDPEEPGRATVREIVAEVAEHENPPAGASKFDLIQLGQNVGLARAYNLAVRRATSLEAAFVLLLDQDSILVRGSVKALLDGYHEADRLTAVGSITCLNIERVRVSVGWEPVISRLRDVLLHRRYETGKFMVAGHVREIGSFTNSGTLIPLPRFHEVGEFNEALFVDAIDYDYSFRLRLRGYRLFLTERAVVWHAQGSPVRRRLFGQEVALRTYSAERSYHITRDTWEFARRWFRWLPFSVAAILFSQIQGTIGMLVLLPDRYPRCRGILRAVWELRGRTGR